MRLTGASEPVSFAATTWSRKESAAARPTSSLWRRERTVAVSGRKQRGSGRFRAFGRKRVTLSYRYCREIMISPFWFKTITIEIMVKKL